MADDDDREEDQVPIDLTRRGASETLSDASLQGARFTGASVDGRQPAAAGHSWVPRGPINVGGRIRTLVVDDTVAATFPRPVFAGASSGGVFRTTDGGLSWTPLWRHAAGHEMPALSVGALAIGRRGDGTVVLWVATGETNKVHGAGVWWVELDAAGTPTWTRKGTLAELRGTSAADPVYISAAAIDPDDPNHCWFVGPTGVYRHRAGAWINLDTKRTAAPLRDGRKYSDVAFVKTSVGRYLVLARADTDFGDLVLIPDPDLGAAALQAILDAAVLGGAVTTPAVPGANLAVPLLPAGAIQPATPVAGKATNAKIAIVAGAAGAADRVYVAHAKSDAGKIPANPLHDLRTAAAIGPGAVSWSVATNWTSRKAAIDSDEDQGHYNLCLTARAGAPGSDHLVFGMVELFFSPDSGVTWHKAIDWHRYDRGDRGYHADQHHAVFVPLPALAPLPALWVANDGGVSVCERYIDAGTGAPPASAAGFRWRRRIHGLVVGQAYDITQSRQLPGLHGAAYQDVGAWLTGGGTTARYLHGGDGLSIEFDPVDPHHQLVSWQGRKDSIEGVSHVRFGGHADLEASGRAWVRTVPAPTTTRRALFRGFDPGRTIGKGIVPGDRATFDDTIAHPTEPGRAVHLRERRAYYTTDGENWRIVQAGTCLELFLHVKHATRAALGATSNIGGCAIEVVRGSAVHKLGLTVGTRSEVRTLAAPSAPPAATDTESYFLHVVGASAPELFRQRDDGFPAAMTVGSGDELHLRVEVIDGSALARNRYSVAVPVTFPNASYTYAQAIERIHAALRALVHANFVNTDGGGGVLPANVTVDARCLPAFAPPPWTVELVTHGVGPAMRLTIGGTAAPKLRLPNGDYQGSAGRPAQVLLIASPSVNLGGNEPPVTAADQVNAGDTIVMTVTTSAGARGAITYTFPEAERAAPPAAPIHGFYLLGRHLTRMLNAQIPDAEPLRARGVTSRKFIRLRSGRTNAVALSTMTFPTFAADAVTTAREGLSSGKPEQLSQPSPAVIVDLVPTLWGRYDLRPTGGAGDSKLVIVIGGARTEIEFLPAEFPGGLAHATVEDVRRVMEAALVGTDIFCDIEHEAVLGSPTEVAYSQKDTRVIWLGGQPDVVFRTADGGLTWRHVLPQGPHAVAYLFDQYIAVEAIAPDPDNADNAYIGYATTPSRAVWKVTAGDWERADVDLVRPAGYEGADSTPAIYALEVDPDDARTIWAATDIGVFRTSDGASSWHLYSEGLPSLPVTDLAFDQATRSLRGAVFGRGNFERHVGDRVVPASPLYLRANDNDSGQRPAPHGPDIGGRTPAVVNAYQSPDIRVTRLDPAILDAVEMDDVAHEPIVPDLASHVLARVHHGGSSPTDDVRVIVLWADVTRRVPELPAAFWTAVTAAAPLSGPWGPWHLVGNRTLGTIVPGGSALASFAKTWTPAELTGVKSAALLAVATTGRTSIEAGPSVVARLVIDEPRVAIRLSDVHGADDGRIYLASSAPVIVGFPLVPPALNFVPLVGPLPTMLARSNPAPFSVAGQTLRIRLQEQIPVPVPPHPALIRDIEIVFDHAPFANPAAVTAAEMRDYLARMLARNTDLVRVVSGHIDVAIRRSPTDGGGRLGETSWTLGDIVVVPTATAPSDEPFDLLRLPAAAPVTIGAAQRVLVRVRNDSAIDVQDARLRVFWLDPMAATPTAVQVGAETVIANLAAHSASIEQVDGPMGPISHSDVLLVAVVHHAADSAPAITPTSWPDVVELIRGSNNVAARTFRRA